MKIKEAFVLIFFVCVKLNKLTKDRDENYVMWHLNCSKIKKNGKQILYSIKLTHRRKRNVQKAKNKNKKSII